MQRRKPNTVSGNAVGLLVLLCWLLLWVLLVLIACLAVLLLLLCPAAVAGQHRGLLCPSLLLLSSPNLSMLEHQHWAWLVLRVLCQHMWD
jgi:hypothetical protein